VIGKLDVQGEFKLPKVLLWAYEYVIMQNFESKEIGLILVQRILIVVHLSNMESGSMLLTTTTRSGAVQLIQRQVIFGPLDGLTDGFGC
jgi:hypothetical protein